MICEVKTLFVYFIVPSSTYSAKRSSLIPLQNRFFVDHNFGDADDVVFEG
jgi:hypothetical protein